MRSVIKCVAALTVITLAWPAASQARNGGSKTTTPKEITITKTNDKSSPKMMESKTKSSLLRGNNSNNQKGGRYLGQ